MTLTDHTARADERGADDVTGNPDILEIGARHAPNDAPHTHRRWLTTHGRLRTAAESALLVTLAAAALAANGTSHPTLHTATPTPPAPQAATHPQAQALATPPLVAPTKATPGEHLYVAATRRPGMCGVEEFRFDNRQLAYQVLTVAYLPNSATVRIMTMTVPATARPGRHEITLYGPMPSTRSGPICADKPEHHGRVTTAPITITTRAPAAAR